MVRVRDACRAVINAQMDGCSDETLRGLQAKLNSAYDSFSRRFGRINDAQNARNGYLKTALEVEEQERAKLWLDSLVRALRDDKCKGEEYRLWQGKAVGNPKRRKNYK